MNIENLVPGYLEEMKLLNRSPLTIRNTGYSLKMLIRFLSANKVTDLDELGREILYLYMEDLTYRLTDEGKQLSVRTREKYLGAARGFMAYLYEQDYLAADLGKYIKLPKQPKPLPKVILDVDEVRRLMAVPDMRTNAGYRNRIILEVLYDTAIRSAEMAGVRTDALDLENGFLTVRSGKGNKDRVVPLCSRVCELVKNYLLVVRPDMVSGKDDGYLVLNRWGNGMTSNAVWAVVKKCASLAAMNKNISTHTFRHSCATHMVRNGAPIRYIQELLGHDSLESTQIYTRVTITDLKKVHAQYHPGEQF